MCIPCANNEFTKLAGMDYHTGEEIRKCHQIVVRSDGEIHAHRDIVHIIE